jgi:hypothetical protein
MSTTSAQRMQSLDRADRGQSIAVRRSRRGLAPTGTRGPAAAARAETDKVLEILWGAGVKMFFIDEIEDRRGPGNLNCKKLA